MIGALVAQGIVVAAGHSSATAAEARAAVDAGVTYVTHLFNAMAPLHHREPGLAGVALTDDRLRVGPDRRRAARRTRPWWRWRPGPSGTGSRSSPTRSPRSGAPPGPVPLGARTAAVSTGDGGVRLPDGTLAGSTLALDQAARNLVAFAGCRWRRRWRRVTTVPARVLGLADRGTLTPGAAGDLVLLTGDGTLVATVVGGRVAHDRREGGGSWRS